MLTWIGDSYLPSIMSILWNVKGLQNLLLHDLPLFLFYSVLRQAPLDKITVIHAVLAKRPRVLWALLTQKLKISEVSVTFVWHAIDTYMNIATISITRTSCGVIGGLISSSERVYLYCDKCMIAHVCLNGIPIGILYNHV